MDPVRTEVSFNQNVIERVILDLADAFDIRIVWDGETALLAGVMALAGGVIGGYAGGKMGAALGVGIGGAAGVGASTVVHLHEIWSRVKEQLKELVYIVFNYLRRLDPVDYERGIAILMACTSSRRELVFTLLDFIAHKLGKEVISSITVS
ncbi:uncharacterized protein LOC111001888 [Pieris rapae]|uniref:uncharacterized protein LOC111001888 n=1 Tax=Pieris rapae TaxID=64459 RepID=UPI000B927C0E|nr:uncharacterized protein LOC111001888 [Pieris rapae]